MAEPTHNQKPIASTETGAEAYDAVEGEQFFHYPVAKILVFPYTNGYDVELVKKTMPDVLGTECENEIKRLVRVTQKLLQKSKHTKSYSTVVEVAACKDLDTPAFVVIDVVK